MQTKHCLIALVAVVPLGAPCGDDGNDTAGLTRRRHMRRISRRRIQAAPAVAAERVEQL